AWGVEPFTYLWSNGGTEQSQIIDFGLHDLCVTVTDALGCVSSACNFDTLDPNESFNFVTGFVYADSVSALSGKVYLYDASTNTGQFELIDSTQIVQGTYRFENLANGLYILQAEVDGDYFPTYHWSSTSWEEASPVALPNWLPVTNDIWMISTDTTNGTGVIGGVVTDPSNIVAAQDGEFRGGAGVPGVNVILSNAEGIAITYTVSLEDGSFRFTDLPFGTYRLSYDIPGVYSPDVWVTLTADEPERLSVSLVITEGSVDVEEPVATEVGIYPNPANEEIKIELPVGETTFDIQIVDMQGKVVHAGSVRNLNGIMLIEVGQYTPGLYHINLMGESKSYFGRFVKQE
ncbi:MAG: T9SS type A sorting domain-containing protein, partial [Saprospiraceae bacterium]